MLEHPGTEIISFDRDGKMLRKEDRNGRITEVENARRVTAVKNTYDRRFRIIHQEFPDGETMEFSYDDKNQCISMTDKLGRTTRMAYDNRGNLTQIRDMAGGNFK